MKRVGLLAAVLVVAVAPNAAAGEAEARPFGLYEKGLYWLAVDYWGGEEPPACSGVRREVVPRARIGGALASVFPFPDELHVKAPEPCYLWLGEELLPDAYRTCYSVVHELGHLHKHEHSRDSRDIMFPFIIRGVTPRLAACSPDALAQALDPAAVRRRERVAMLQQRCPGLASSPGRGAIAGARPVNRHAQSRCWEKLRALRSDQA